MNDAAAEIELRNITNRLLKISAKFDIDKMEREAQKYYFEFKRSFPESTIYFHRRVLDVKRLMYIEKMNDEEISELYIEYQKNGFDGLYHKISSLFFLHRYAFDQKLKTQIEDDIVKLIRDYGGDPAIQLELSWMPDLVQKALGARKSD